MASLARGQRQPSAAAGNERTAQTRRLGYSWSGLRVSASVTGALMVVLTGASV
jgi:hypothetical protein